MSSTRLYYSVLLLFIGLFCEPLIRENDVLTVAVWGMFILINFDIWQSLKIKEYKVLNFFLIGLALATVISVVLVQGEIELYLEPGGRGTKVIRAVFKSLGLLSSIFFVEYSVSKNKGMTLLRILFSYFIIFVFISDLHALLFVSRSFINKEITHNLYIAGNKFDLTYTNIYLLVVYTKYSILKRSFRIRNFYLLLALCILMAFYSRCSTSVIACAFLLIFFVFKVYHRKFIYYSTTYVIFTIVCTFILMLFSAVVLSSEFVKSILISLGESEDLTFRLVIWEQITPLFFERPIFGFGVGNVGGIVNNLTNVYDSQNGVIDLYLQVGLVGVFFYFGMLIFCLRKSSLHESSMAIAAFLYMILLISIVEIPLTYSVLFLSSLALIYPYREKTKYKVK